MTSPLVRVATVPARHPYLDSALPPDVRRVPVAGAGPWAPSPLLEPDGLAAWAPGIDLVHLHFGFDHLSVGQLRRWTGALDVLDVPLVLTVHDLRNPHHEQPGTHDEHLGVLVPAAAQVLTLTAGAAREIATRWGVGATVVAHPAVLALPVRGTTTPGLVGVHLKSLRRNVVEPDRVVAAVLRGVRAGGGALRVDVHPDTVDAPALAGVRTLAGAGELELRAHERMTDAELAGYLRGLHVSVLAQRFGTHSGWLEACRDVGTALVAPTCGHYGEQWSQVHLYAHDERHGLDAGSLAAAVHAALTGPPPAPADPVFRAEQRHQVHRAHTEAYRRAMATRRGPE